MSPRPDRTEEPPSSEDRSRRARLFWIRQDRDSALARLSEEYLPRLRGLHDELSAKREQVWREYERRVAEVDGAGGVD